MTDYTEYTRTANAAVAEGLRQITDVKLATTEVLHSLTSVLVPLSVALLPESEELVPAIDTVVDRTFDIVIKLVQGASRHDVEESISAAHSVRESLADDAPWRDTPVDF